MNVRSDKVPEPGVGTESSVTPASSAKPATNSSERTTSSPIDSSATEDLVYMLESMGFETGQDIEALLGLRSRVADWLRGEPMHGVLWRAGLPKTMRSATSVSASTSASASASASALERA